MTKTLIALAAALALLAPQALPATATYAHTSQVVTTKKAKKAKKAKILSHPQGRTYTEGKTMKFTVKARGKKKTYRWQVKPAGAKKWSIVKKSMTTNGKHRSRTMRMKATKALHKAKFRVKVTHRVKTKKGKTVKRTMTSKAVRMKVKEKKVTPRPTPTPTPIPTPTPEPEPWCRYEDRDVPLWVVTRPYQPPVYHVWEEIELVPRGHYPVLGEDGHWYAGIDFIPNEEWQARPYDQYGTKDNSPYPYRPGTIAEEGRYRLILNREVAPGMLPKQHSTSRHPWWYYEDLTVPRVEHTTLVTPEVPEEGYWTFTVETVEVCS